MTVLSILRPVLLAAAFTFLAGCASVPTGKSASPPAARPAIPADPAARSADLDALVRGLESGHPAFREKGGAELKRVFEADAEKLRDRLPALRTEEAEVEMARLVASLGDGHTGLVLPTYAILPFDLYRFEEGWFITSVSAEYGALLGSRLLALGDVPIEELESRLAPIVPHDNASGLASQLRYRLIMPDILAGIGVLAPGTESARVAVASPDGERIETEMDVWRYGEPQPSFLSVEVPADAALSRTRTSEPYWASMIPGTRTLYAAYNRCREDPKRPMKAFAREVDAILASGAADRVIVDLRNNGGGSSPLFWPLLRVLAKGARDGIPVFTTIGRKTFSSAVLNAVELARGDPGVFGLFAPSAAAVFVGEPSGGRPNHYGEVVSFTLPNSGLRVQHSTKHFNFWPGDPDALEPAIAAPPTWADYVSGRDAAIEAVIAIDLSEKGAK